VPIVRVRASIAVANAHRFIVSLRKIDVILTSSLNASLYNASKVELGCVEEATKL